MTTTDAAVIYSTAEHVAHITLSRPDALNTMNLELMTGLRDSVVRAEQDPDVRVVLLRGNGPSFCGGGDLRSFADQGERLPVFVRELAEVFHQAISRLAHLEVPVVAAVRGSTVGGGFSLACVADLIVSSHTATFGLAYSRLGFTLDGGMSYSLPRLVGLRRALDLALTNRMLTPEEAYDLGIVTEVVADEDLEDRSRALTLQLAAGPRWAQGQIKRLLRNSWTNSIDEQLAAEARAVAEATGRPDGREGLAAFLEKRSPKFEGV